MRSAQAQDCQPLRERRALYQFHDERRHAVGVFETVDLRDVRMIQRREGFGFALEAREALRIIRDGAEQDFDGDIAIELRVTRAIDHAHPAFAEGRDDLVRAEARAGSKCRRRQSGGILAREGSKHG